MQLPDKIEKPKGVELYDFDDHKSLRKNIFSGIQSAFETSFPASYGGVRVELNNVRYEGPEKYDLDQQKQAILKNKFLTRKLKGTMTMYDEETGDKLDEMDTSLMKVPWLTPRSTFIHGGNEYSTIMQSRLLPGVYTRRQANGQLETQFNVRPGTGIGFRVGFEPETAQYRLRISQANLHMYSLLHDLGVPDEDLAARWGKDVLDTNKSKYDARVFEKAYQRLVPPRFREEEATHEDKAEAIQAAFAKAQLHRSVASRNLPGMLNTKRANEVRAVWAGKAAMIKRANDALDAMQFDPDYTVAEVLDKSEDLDFEKQGMFHMNDRMPMANYYSRSFPNTLKNIFGIKEAKDTSALATLLKAKKHSDNKEYDRKSALMTILMQQRPEEFIVDQEDDNFPGITHLPTSFKMHVPKAIIPKSLPRPKTYYHGSPLSELEGNTLREGSFISPDKDVAELMGRFHEATGETWSDADMEEPYEFGSPAENIKWKEGREPMGSPSIHEMTLAANQLDDLDNPYEHKLLKDHLLS